MEAPTELRGHFEEVVGFCSRGLHYSESMRNRATRVTAASRVSRIEGRLRIARRFQAGVIRTLDSTGREGTTYLKNVKVGDTVTFIRSVSMPGLSIDEDALGTVVHVDLDGPTLHVRVDVQRDNALGGSLNEEVVSAHPDDVELLVHSEDPRLT